MGLYLPTRAMNVLGVGDPSGASGGLAPNAFPNLQAWHAADYGTFTDTLLATPTTLNGDVVGSWYNKAATAWHPIQATEARKPTWRTNVVNGLPIMRFDGSNDRLAFPSAAFGMLNNIGGFTVYAVSASAASHAGYIFFGSENSGSARSTLQYATTSRIATFDRRLDGVGGQTLSGTNNEAPNATFKVFSTVVDYTNSDAFLYVNGALSTTSTSFLTDGSTSATNSTVINYGATGSGATPLNGDIAEILVYNVAHTAAATRSAIHSYLGAKYGITVS